MARGGKKRRIAFWAAAVFSGTLAAGAVFILVVGLTLPDVSGLKSRTPASTSLMRQREAEAAKAGRPFAARGEWVAFESIPSLLKKAVLVSEDAAFYEHKGIDFSELKVAIKQGMKEKRIVRGASTITQQLAKNLYLSTDRTLWRKLKEILLAKRLEKALPKNRIFALYLNLIEFGPGVFGVQAASRHWFDKDAADLTPEDAVRLAAIIPRPLRSDPRTNDAWMKFKGKWIADTLKAVGAISPDEHAALIRSFE
jgi:monofunctional biosynthetic peptidoglycan transglycosylase